MAAIGSTHLSEMPEDGKSLIRSIQHLRFFPRIFPLTNIFEREDRTEGRMEDIMEDRLEDGEWNRGQFPH